MPMLLAVMTGVVYGLFAAALVVDVAIAVWLMRYHSPFMAAGALIYGGSCFFAAATGCAQGSQQLFDPILFRISLALLAAAIVIAVGALSQIRSSRMEVCNNGC